MPLRPQRPRARRRRPGGRRRLGRRVPAVLAQPDARRGGRPAGVGRSRQGIHAAGPAGRPRRARPVSRRVQRRPSGAVRRPPRRGPSTSASATSSPMSCGCTTSTPTTSSPRSRAAVRWPSTARATSTLETEHRAFGVPTFIIGDQAVFVRLMTRPEGDGELAAHHDRPRPRPPRRTRPSSTSTSTRRSTGSVHIGRRLGRDRTSATPKR